MQDLFEHPARLFFHVVLSTATLTVGSFAVLFSCLSLSSRQGRQDRGNPIALFELGVSPAGLGSAGGDGLARTCNQSEPYPVTLVRLFSHCCMRGATALAWARHSSTPV